MTFYSYGDHAIFEDLEQNIIISIQTAPRKTVPWRGRYLRQFITHAVGIRRARRRLKENLMQVWEEDTRSKSLPTNGDIFDLRCLFGLPPLPREGKDELWDALVEKFFGPTEV